MNPCELKYTEQDTFSNSMELIAENIEKNKILEVDLNLNCKYKHSCNLNWRYSKRVGLENASFNIQAFLSSMVKIGDHFLISSGTEAYHPNPGGRFGKQWHMFMHTDTLNPSSHWNYMIKFLELLINNSLGYFKIMLKWCHLEINFCSSALAVP